MITPRDNQSRGDSGFFALLLALLLILQLVPLSYPTTTMENVVEPSFSGGNTDAWSDGGQAWPQFGRFGSHNGTAPQHSTIGGPGLGSVDNVTELMTIEDPAVNWHHFSSSSYGAQGLASTVADFSNNIVISGNAGERCGEGHLSTPIVSERDSGGSTHSYLSIIDGDTSREMWEVDLGVTDSVKAAPVVLDLSLIHI